MAKAATSPSSGQKTPELQVAMTDVVQFVRQLSHDLRNNLNATELQLAFIAEIAADPEVKSEVQRLRGMMSQLASSLQKVNAAVGQVTLAEMPYPAKDFVEDLRAKVAKEFPEDATSVDWQQLPSDGELNIDPQMLEQALIELFRNAFQHARGEGMIRASASNGGEAFTFELREPKKEFAPPTSNWGNEPFRQIGPGRYGLGLHRTRRIVEAHHGELRARFEPAEATLVTTVTLPLERPAAEKT